MCRRAKAEIRGRLMKLNGRQIRFWLATAVVLLPLAVLVVIAIGTWKANLSFADHAALLSTGATFAAVFLAVEAAVVAIRAYAAATQVPDVTILVGPWDAQTREVCLRAIRSEANNGVRMAAGPDTVLDIEMTLECRTKVSAHHPAVRLEFVGLTALSRSQEDDWEDLEKRGMRRDWTRHLQWDGGSDTIIHGTFRRSLPPVTLNGAVIDPSCKRYKLLIDVVADGFHTHRETNLRLDLRELTTGDASEGS